MSVPAARTRLADANKTQFELPATDGLLRILFVLGSGWLVMF
jgi:hypothetical protein